jgi:pimeloyl-ACP methyl ester carboxylesterase
MTNVKAITFVNDDECGSVAQHATELRNIVNDILSGSPYDKVNIVAHSKGGLDARWYIANNNIDKVANLIMIGTPNSGTTAAFSDLTGCAAFPGSDSDLWPNSEATQAADRNSTHYYTIAGNLAIPCFFTGFFVSSCYLLPNDGLVTVTSAQCTYDHCYTSLAAPFPYNHEELLTQKDVYEKVLPILSNGN